MFSSKFWIHDEQDENVPSSEDDDVPDPEDAEEVIILEEVTSGESGAVVASPNENCGQNQAPNNKKRKQKEITDFFAKNTSIKNKFMRKNCLLMSRLTIRHRTHYKAHFFREFTVPYSESGL